MRLALFAILCLSPTANIALGQPPFGGGFPGGGPPGGFRGPDPDEIVERLDDNRNGQVDLDEMEGRSRFFLDMLARDNGLDLSKPVKNDTLRGLLKARFGGGSSGSSSGGSSNVRTASTSGVAGFGTTASTAKTPGFGADGGADGWDALKAKYDGRIIQEVQESLRRNDRNNDGILDAEELKNGQWRSDPREYDKNKDGKLSRSELAERYKARYGGGSSGYGPPGGYGFPGGYGPPSGYGAPPGSGSSSSGGSSTSSSSKTSSSTGSSGGSSSAGSSNSGGSTSGSSSSSGGDDRVARYAEGLLRQYDTNKDGVLQKDEWSRMRGEPQKADRDNNGLITKDELARQLGDYGRGSSGGSTSSGGSSAAGGSYSSAARSSSSATSGGPRKTYRFLSATERLPKGLPDWFTRNDADGDGQIAMSEFAAAWDDAKAGEFAGWDRDGDGLITPKEALRAK